MNFFMKLHNKEEDQRRNTSIYATNEAEYVKSVLLSDFNRYFNYPEIMSFLEEKKT